MQEKIKWDDYKYFEEREFRCSHTGMCHMDEGFINLLSKIREDYGRPMIITSGYRHPTHPIEASKTNRGEHTYGVCCDVAVRGEDCYDLMALCFKYNIPRVGVSQKGGGRFVHIGMGYRDLFPSPTIWSY